MVSYLSASDFYKEKFGCKVYKIAVDAGCTCPTRDGTKENRGCIFCSQSGSGEFASLRNKPIAEQIEDAKKLINKKVNGRKTVKKESPDSEFQNHFCGKYIVYFQNFTNTYGDHDTLERKYREAAGARDIAGIAIATRPDCIDSDMLNRIASISKETFVSIELGLQTTNETTAKYIRRGYTNDVYFDAVRRIKKAAPQIHVVTHVIFGLPGDSESDMMQTVRDVVKNGSDGIKFTELFILEGTDLAEEYKAGRITDSYECMTQNEYFTLVQNAIALLPSGFVVHRVSGDPPQNTLIAPLWAKNKRRVHNEWEKMIAREDQL